MPPIRSMGECCCMMEYHIYGCYYRTKRQQPASTRLPFAPQHPQFLYFPRRWKGKVEFHRMGWTHVHVPGCCSMEFQDIPIKTSTNKKIEKINMLIGTFLKNTAKTVANFPVENSKTIIYSIYRSNCTFKSILSAHRKRFGSSENMSSAIRTPLG